MRKVLLSLALLAGVEGAALACSCIPPGSIEESRGLARVVLQGVVAVVEGEVISEYRFEGPGEEVRVHRILLGDAPRTLRIERGPSASSASCDLLLTKGERKILILKQGQGGTYQMQSLCSDYLTSEEYLSLVMEEAGRSLDTPNKAGERASSCPKGTSGRNGRLSFSSIPAFARPRR